jgi:hypothetical protein
MIQGMLIQPRLCLSMLLSTLETTIVSTSLVSMVNELQGFSQAGWVITAYFLTYTGEWLLGDVDGWVHLLTASSRIPRHIFQV